LRDWDNRERNKQKEPSAWFYGFVTGLGLGALIGIALMLLFSG